MWFKHVMYLWPISAIDGKQMRGYEKNDTAYDMKRKLYESLEITVLLTFLFILI